MLLGVNIDHVATLRQARGEDEPCVADAAKTALEAGADGITIHLREDRRHIIDSDVYDIRKQVPRLNLEMAVNPEVVAIATEVRPDFACLVPERREEVTTEGGLDVIGNADRLAHVIPQLQAVGTRVSLFIDPVEDQIRKAKDLKADYIEIHTGAYALATGQNQQNELNIIRNMARLARTIGLSVNAGHGLKYYNVTPIAQITEIEELNIGHSIISRALFVGLKTAIQEMKALLTTASQPILNPTA